MERSCGIGRSYPLQINTINYLKTREMDKTININLGGILFSLEEDAYHTLRDYLQSIDMKFRNAEGGNETIEDIELRIAEIFQSQRGTAGVITRQNVDNMISVIGQPEDFGSTEEEGDKDLSGKGHSFQRKYLYRNSSAKIIGGVCSGMGDYFNTDPVWFRILFIILTLMYGLGIFIYIVLWIALPSVSTNSSAGSNHISGLHRYNSGNRYGNTDPASTTSSGNAVNEVFGAMGKGIYIIARVFLIILGVLLLACAFLALFSFIMVFILKFPSAFATDITGFHLTWIPDFINYLVEPGLVPWVKALIIATVSIPLLMIIYGAIRLIFWFRANDGYLWLTGLIIWLLSAAALSVIMFNEGIGFAEYAKAESQNYFYSNPDTLFILTGAKLSDLDYDNEIVLPNEDYSIFFSDNDKQMFVYTPLDILPSQDGENRLVVIKKSAGRSKRHALENANSLLYNYEIIGDTLIIDEYSTIPHGSKWSFHNLSLRLLVPGGTVVYMDETTARQLRSVNNFNDSERRHKKSYWIMTDNGLSSIK